MARERRINFGHFVRQERERMQLSRSQFIARAAIQLSERRLWQIEMQMPVPKVQRMKFEAIARGLGLNRDELDKRWRATPVAAPVDEGRTRGTELREISRWLIAEAQRLNLPRGKSAEMLMKLLRGMPEAERDRYYRLPSVPVTGPAPMRIPAARRDTRLVKAAKTIGMKKKT